MSNALYPSFKTLLLGADLALDADTIKCVLVDATYTYSAAHDFLNDVVSGNRVAISSALASKTIAAGTFDAADLTFSAVTGDPITGLIFYKDTGTESTSPLIAFFDTDASSDPIALTPNGSDIQLTLDVLGIFTL